MNLDEIKKINISQKPGCYLFKNNDGVVIYVGKAVNLRNRVYSYFRDSANHSPAKFSMLKQISKIEWIETESEIEALLLEVNLIKNYKPDYNIVMRDDKRHVYIKISTEDEWPRIFMTRKLDKSGKYFGPFVSTEAVRETLKAVRKIWPYRSCSNMPKKACLYYRIGKCPGVCEEQISKTEYLKILKQITLFLEGKKEYIVNDYKKRIETLEWDFKKNKADNSHEIKLLKYRLLNMEKVLAHSNILSLYDKYASDVIELAKVLNLSKVPKRIEGFDISNINGKDAVGSMVVFIEGEANKDEYRKFKIKSEREGDVWMLKEVIERRLSHMNLNGSTANFGSKSNIWDSPDLIIIDGGKAQLNVFDRIFKTLKLEIPIIAVSKGEGLRSAKAPDKIFFQNEKKPLELPLSSPALHIIKRVRDEAHRFAISYHKKIRHKRFLTTD